MPSLHLNPIARHSYASSGNGCLDSLTHNLTFGKGRKEERLSKHTSISQGTSLFEAPKL